MRMIKKGLLTIVLTLLTIVTLVFGVACREDPEKIKLTLNYNTSGASTVDTVEVVVGDAYTLPTLSQEGYEFQGWYTNAEFSGEPVTELVAAIDAAYYAKWEQLYLLTLDVNGGTLEGVATSIYVKAGETVYDYVKDYAPEKANYVFGAWFNGNKELSKSFKMPQEALTVTAKYKVAYTVEIFEQNETLDGYVMRTETGYEYPGVKFTSEPDTAGFKSVGKPEDGEWADPVYTLTISETASENVFRHYFDRTTYKVTFNANYPDGTSEEWDFTNVLTGVGIEVLSNVTFEGYCLLGWATSKDGEMKYPAKYIENALYGATASEAAPFIPQRNTTLYAVWQQGYADMFGSSDYIYLIEKELVDEESGETSTEYALYLSRGGVFFEGEYRALTNRFSIVDNRDDILLEGQLYDNYRYIYKDSTRRDVSYQKFETGVGLTNGKLYLDEYDGITYSVTDASNFSHEVKGTYYIDEYGYYNATFTEGAFGEVFGDDTLTEKTLTMMLGYVQNSSGGYDRAFQLRNDEEYNMGMLVRFGIYQNTVSYYNGYQVMLDGFGNAYMFTDEQSYTTYYYTYDSATQTLTFLNSNGSTAGEAIVSEQEVLGQTVKGYAMYSEDFDATYTFDGGKLIMDGTFNITYEQKDGSVLEGYYTTAASALGGTLVSFTAGGNAYNFMITKIENEFNLGDQIITTVEYKVEEKSLDYAEYYYVDPEGIYYAPLLTINGPVGDNPNELSATMYGYTVSRTYEKVSYGKLVYDQNTGLYTYTAEEILEVNEEVSTTVVDLYKIQTMVCALDTTATAYAIHYWYSYDTGEGEPVECDKYYTSSLDDNATLALVSGIAIYKAGGAVVMGQYATDENGITQIVTASGAAIYVKIDGETFATLDHAPFDANLLTDNGNDISSKEYLSFDGLGGVSYTTTITNEEGEDVKVPYVGTMEQTGVTAFGSYIYTFKAEKTETQEALQFTYILIPYGNGYLFAKENTTYELTYQGEYGKLDLDGYGYWATYKVGETVYEGKYYIEEENVVTMVIDDVIRYFDLKEDKTFGLRGEEYGEYYYVKNQYIENLYFEMDGYGGLTVYTMVENAEGTAERKDIDTEASYSINGDVVTLTYDNEGTLTTKKGEFEIGEQYRLFIEKLENGVAQTYVNAADLSVLVLDDLGNATKYTAQGVKENGYYTLITDAMLYYVNETSTDACIYNYNTATGSATMVELNPTGYYTEELESLIFTEYGFAIFGGDTRYYYNVDVSGVTIYIEAETGEDHNGYGFKEIPLEILEDETTGINYIVWGEGEEEDVYYATSGYTLTFARPEGVETYPIDGDVISTVSFAPTGNGEFTVAGTLVVDGEGKTCYVTRDIKEDGSVEMYITYGLYRLDISVNYKGDGNNTYEITRMRWIFNAPNYNYAFMYAFYYMFGGSDLANTLENTIGEMNLVVEYDDAGVELRNYLTANLMDDSGMYNTEGEIVSFGEIPVYDLAGNQVNVGEIKISSEEQYHLYKASFESAGYKYHLYFFLEYFPYMESIIDYRLVAFTREEVFTKDGYTAKVESVITSDAGYAVGYPYNVTLTYTEGETTTEIKGEAWYQKDGYLYYIVRERDEETGRIKNSVYYKLLLIEKADDIVGGDGTIGGDEGDNKEEEVEVNNPLPVYDPAAFTVTVESVMTVYGSNGTDYVDITTETHEARILAVLGTPWIVYQSSYDEETGIYTVKLSETIVYEIEIVEGEDGSKTATITEVVVTEEEDSEDAA